MALKCGWYGAGIRGVLLDISGVLYNSSDDGGVAIEGSVDAVKRLRDSNVPVRLCSNSTHKPAHVMLETLHSMGFSMITGRDLFLPAPVVRSYLEEQGLRPHLVVYPKLESEFDSLPKNDPNCVVLGDAGEAFSYKNLNKAFELLINMKNPILISMGRGKYYLEDDVLKLDVGAYMKALEYACDVKAEIIGKPSKTFFHAAVKDMGIKPEETLMIGDDVVNDVGGAQEAGMRGVLVRTGKYRPQDEKHPDVKPDGVVDDLAQAVNILLENR